MSAKLKDAQDHMVLAEKALKTGMFKWNPDYDTAASEYTKAATSFKLGGATEKCKDAYIKAATMQEKNGTLFHSAKLLAQAAGIASDLKNMEEAVALMEKACDLYRTQGSTDTAATTLAKAAKMCESSLPDKSVELYMQAADISEDDEKLREASQYLNKASCVEIKQKRYIKSAEITKKRLELVTNLGSFELGYHVILGLIITYLAEGDYVAADEAYKSGFELSGFGESDEATYSEHFLKAFEEGDAELLTKTQSQPTVTHLDTEFARLAKSLKLPDFEAAKPSAASSTSISNEGSSDNTRLNETNNEEIVEEEDDEFSNDLR